MCFFGNGRQESIYSACLVFGSKVMLHLLEAVKKMSIFEKSGAFSFIMQTIELKKKKQTQKGEDQGKVLLEVPQNLSNFFPFSILLAQNFCSKITPFRLLEGSHCTL